MDLGFLRRGFARRSSARPDYQLLVAGLQALQHASPGARAETLACASRGALPLVDILLGAECWREAALAQRGCFNAGQARRLGKAASTQMTSPFTLAF